MSAKEPDDNGKNIAMIVLIAVALVVAMAWKQWNGGGSLSGAKRPPLSVEGMWQPTK